MVNGASKMAETLGDSQLELYRQTAEKLRQLAAEIRFDFCRRQQLLALADAFDRRARLGERPPIRQAAD